MVRYVVLLSILASLLSAQDYPLETCLVKGTPLGNNPVVIQHQGVEVRLCCNSCVKRFRADPQPYLAALHAAMQEPAYPCDFCVVSGDPLDADAVEFRHDGIEVKVCSKDCKKLYKRRDTFFGDKIRRAAVDYPLQTCLVDSAALPDEPFLHTHLGEQLRLCGPDCSSAFDAEPERFLAILHEASFPSCPVCDDPILDQYVERIHHQEVLYLVCERSCAKKFNKRPDKYLPHPPPYDD